MSASKSCCELAETLIVVMWEDRTSALTARGALRNTAYNYYMYTVLSFPRKMFIQYETPRASTQADKREFSRDEV